MSVDAQKAIRDCAPFVAKRKSVFLLVENDGPFGLELSGRPLAKPLACCLPQRFGFGGDWAEERFHAELRRPFGGVLSWSNRKIWSSRLWAPAALIPPWPPG